MQRTTKHRDLSKELAERNPVHGAGTRARAQALARGHSRSERRRSHARRNPPSARIASAGARIRRAQPGISSRKARQTPDAVGHVEGPAKSAERSSTHRRRREQNFRGPGESISRTRSAKTGRGVLLAKADCLKQKVSRQPRRASPACAPRKAARCLGLGPPDAGAVRLVFREPDHRATTGVAAGSVEMNSRAAGSAYFVERARPIAKPVARAPR